MYNSSIVLSLSQIFGLLYDEMGGFVVFRGDELIQGKETGGMQRDSDFLPHLFVFRIFYRKTVWIWLVRSR